MTELAAAFLLGLAGSSHCLVMCGPLTLVFRSGVSRGPWRSGLVYHGGRVVTYAGLGIVAGLVGSAFTTGGVGRLASVAAGLLLLAAAGTQMGSWGLPSMPWIGRRVARAITFVHRRRQGLSLIHI